MKVDLRYIQRLAFDLGFQPASLEKCWRLTTLLSRFVDHPQLGKALLLRGGTAINFLYADLPRLSVDVDLDYIGALEKERMLKDRPFIEEEIRKIVLADGYRVARENRSYELTQFILRYSNINGSNDDVKVELDWLNRLPVLDPVNVRFRHPFDIPSFPILTLRKEELLAGKVVAFLDRRAARDLFDLHGLAQGSFQVKTPLLRKLVVFLGCTGNQDFQRQLNVDVGKLDQTRLERELRPLLRRVQSVNFSKVWGDTEEFLRKLLKLSQHEREFISDFYQKKASSKNITKLFGGTKISPRILQHPRLLWRLQRLNLL